MNLTAIVDLALAITAVEGLVVYSWWRFTGQGPAPQAWLPNLAAGLLLMVALRLQSVDASMAWVVLCLTSSGLAHGLDLLQRWPARSVRLAAVGPSGPAPTPPRFHAPTGR